MTDERLEALKAIFDNAKFFAEGQAPIELSDFEYGHLATYYNASHNLTAMLKIAEQWLYFFPRDIHAHWLAAAALVEYGLANKNYAFLGQAVPFLDTMEAFANTLDDGDDLKNTILAFYYEYKGKALLETGRSIRDVSMMEKAIELAQHSINRLGKMYENQLLYAFSLEEHALFTKQTDKLYEAKHVLETFLSEYPQCFRGNSKLTETYRSLFWCEGRPELISKAIGQAHKTLELVLSSPDFTASARQEANYDLAAMYTERVLIGYGSSGSSQSLHDFQSALGFNETSLQLDPHHFLSLYIKGSLLWYLGELEGPHRYQEALPFFMRAFYLDNPGYDAPDKVLTYLVTTYHLPNFICRIRKLLFWQHSQQQSLRPQLEYLEMAWRKQRNLLAHVLRELRKQYSGEALAARLLLYKALAEHLGGDFIVAFELHDGKLDELFEQDLRHQYYYVLNAENIQHEDAASIKSYALSFARQFLIGNNCDLQQSYYAANILRAAGELEQATAIFETIHTNYWPASFKLTECYDELQQRDQLNMHTKWIHETGRRNELSENPFSGSSAISELDHLLSQQEAANGWFICEAYISDEEEKKKAASIPLTRLKWNWDYSQTIGNYPTPNREELAALQPELLESIEKLCRERLEDIFPAYEQANIVDPLRLAENIYSHILSEALTERKIQFSDYVQLLQYCYIKGKIGIDDYLRISTFLNLKYSVLDKRKANGSLHQVISNTFSVVVTPMLQFVAETSLSLPISLVVKVILENAEDKADTIRAMNYEYFLRNFSRLKDYAPDDLAIAIKAHKKYGSIKDLLDPIIA